MKKITLCVMGCFGVFCWLGAPVLAANFSPLSDTGQSTCYNVNGDVIPCPAPGEALYGQDANYQGAPPSFTDNGDGTITDNNTGLVWMKNTADTNGDSIIDSNDELTWQDAIDYCAGLGNGWRLPERIELRSIVDYGRYNPAINTAYFSCQSSAYWSASTDANYTYSAWTIDFYNGYVYTYYKTNTYYVRCVRAGQ